MPRRELPAVENRKGTWSESLRDDGTSLKLLPGKFVCSQKQPLESQRAAFKNPVKSCMNLSGCLAVVKVLTIYLLEGCHLHVELSFCLNALIFPVSASFDRDLKVQSATASMHRDTGS